MVEKFEEKQINLDSGYQAEIAEINKNYYKTEVIIQKLGLLESSQALYTSYQVFLAELVEKINAGKK